MVELDPPPIMALDSPGQSVQNDPQLRNPNHFCKPTAKSEKAERRSYEKCIAKQTRGMAE
jgi:hypothetical protein